MSTEQIVQYLDAEIKKLTEARELLVGVDAIPGSEAVKPKRGRPFKVATHTAVPASKKAARKGISAEGRQRIADAMKARWAARKGSVKTTKPAKPAKSAKKAA